MEICYVLLDIDGFNFVVQFFGGMIICYVYDSEFYLWFVVFVEGCVIEYCYDVVGNCIVEIVYVVNLVSIVGLVESYSWVEQDFVNWVVGIVDKLIMICIDMIYEFCGNVVMFISYVWVDVVGNGIFDEGILCMFYVYDQFGSLLSKWSIVGNVNVFGMDLFNYVMGNLSVVLVGMIVGKLVNFYIV